MFSFFALSLNSGVFLFFDVDYIKWASGRRKQAVVGRLSTSNRLGSSLLCNPDGKHTADNHSTLVAGFCR